MNISEGLKLLGPFGLLCHIHNHIWRDKCWPLTTRLSAFHEVWTLKSHVRRRSLAAVIFILWLLPQGVSAQTVSPVIVEIGAKGAKPFTGSFTITNPGVTPITAVVEAPKSMTFTGGQPILHPLDPGVTLYMSSQSARIGARQGATFWYKLTCNMKPCAVTVYTTVTGQHAARGMAVAVHLPHVIYGCEKQKNCRKSVIAGGRP